MLQVALVLSTLTLLEYKLHEGRTYWLFYLLIYYCVLTPRTVPGTQWVLNLLLSHQK